MGGQRGAAAPAGPFLVLTGAAWDARALAGAGLPAETCPNLQGLCEGIVAGAAGAIVWIPALEAGASSLAEALLRSPLAPNFPIVVPAPGSKLPAAARILEYLANVVPLDPATPLPSVVSVLQGFLRAAWGAAEESRSGLAAPEFDLLQAVPAGVLVGDLRGGVSYVNDRFLEMLELTRDDVLSNGVPWERLTAPESRGRGDLAVRELETAGHCRPYRKTFLTPGGRRVPTLVSASVLRRSADGTALVAVFLVDLPPVAGEEPGPHALGSSAVRAGRARSPF